MGKDYFPALYDYCNSISEYVLGVTPQANCNATVVYGTKSSANMGTQGSLPRRPHTPRNESDRLQPFR